MSDTVIPALLKAMRTQFTTALPGVSVTLGPTTLNVPGTALYVGVSDPEAAGYTSAVSYSQTWPHATAQSREERFRVNLATEAIDGSGDIDAVLDAVWGVYSTVAALVRSSKTLGVPGVLWISMSEESGNHDFAQSAGGAYALLTFSMTVTARI